MPDVRAFEAFMNRSDFCIEMTGKLALTLFLDTSSMSNLHNRYGQMNNILVRMIILFALSSTTLAASDAYPPARFADPGRVAKLQSDLHNLLS